jgi:RNA polymerase sigma-19 factor, ECF subfamily
MSNKSFLTNWREQWNRSLMHFLRRRVHVAVDIEDLAQETYLRLLRAPDLSDVRNPHAYLLTVASHVASEWRERQLPPGSQVELTEEMLVDEGSLELDLDTRLSEKRLERALASAPPTIRAVLLLRLRSERSCEDIGKALNLSDRQVRRYLARGYEHLRASMEG